MNPFDAVVTALAMLAIVLGFMSGLLRSLATILGYLVAAPIAIALAPSVSALVLSPERGASPGQAWIVLSFIFIAVGIGISALFRIAINELVGPDAGLFDRVAGAALGAVRIGLVAVLIVVIFDRVIPAGHEPQFLVGSKFRPYLSAAGQKGLQSLPPEVEDYIDQIKRERGL